MHGCYYRYKTIISRKNRDYFVIGQVTNAPLELAKRTLESIRLKDSLGWLRVSF